MWSVVVVVFVVVAIVELPRMPVDDLGSARAVRGRRTS